MALLTSMTATSRASPPMYHEALGAPVRKYAPVRDAARMKNRMSTA